MADGSRTPDGPTPQGEYIREALRAIEAAMDHLHQAVAAGELGGPHSVDPLLALRDAKDALDHPPSRRD